MTIWTPKPPCEVIRYYWIMDGYDGPQEIRCRRDADHVLHGEIAICSRCLAEMEAGEKVILPEHGTYRAWLLALEKFLAKRKIHNSPQ